MHRQSSLHPDPVSDLRWVNVQPREVCLAGNSEAQRLAFHMFFQVFSDVEGRELRTWSPVIDIVQGFEQLDLHPEAVWCKGKRVSCCRDGGGRGVR